MATTVELFGPSVDGQPVHVITLSVGGGKLVAKICTWGATLLSVQTADRDGHMDEITLNHKTPQDVTDSAKNEFFGKIAGRVANGMRAAQFSLNGTTYQLAANDGKNHLHGGNKGFDQRVWTLQKSGQTASAESSDCSGSRDSARQQAYVTLCYISPDGEEGYPGEVTAHCTYVAQQESDGSCSLGWLLSARLASGHGESESTAPATPAEKRIRTGGADSTSKRSMSTPINLVNHTYWNLSGGCKRDVLGHTLQLDCSAYLPVDAETLPTGKVVPVEGTAFDFREPKTIGRDLTEELRTGPQLGFDHCFVCGDSAATAAAIGAELVSPDNGVDACHDASVRLHRVGRLFEEQSGRVMTVFSTRPGVQLYLASNVMPPERFDNDPAMRQYGACCLETQAFPDAINHEEWRDSVILRPGEVFESRTLHQFSVL